MKGVAGSLLLVAAVVDLLALRAGDRTWVGYVRAAAEAGMVGGLADWFAVTALFRKPLGLPVPHTAIIPTRKAELGRGLSDFVGTHFLSAGVVRQRLRSVGIAARLGGWLAQPSNAARVTDEAANALRGVVRVLRDDDVRAVLEQTIVPRLRAASVGPPLGRLLDQVVQDRAHDGLVQLAVDQAYTWLSTNEHVVVSAVSRQAPLWSPKFVDDAVASRVYRELVRVAGDVRADRDHPLRRSIDLFLTQTAQNLQNDLETMHRAEQLKESLLSHPAVRSSMGDIFSSVRTMLLDAIATPDSELRRRATEGLASFGARLVEDAALRDKVGGWVETVAGHLVSTYRGEITATITETIDRWDGEETSRKVELAVGRDLQFIRVNGTVVGSLAGLAIHAVTQLAG